MNDEEQSSPEDCPTSDVDLWSDEVLADPYPAYRALRDLGRVVRPRRHGLLALTQYGVVRSTLTNWQQFSSAAGVGVDDVANEAMPPSTIKSDPPAHDNHRKPLASQLSVGSLADEVGIIEQTAQQIVSACRTLGGSPSSRTPGRGSTRP